MRQVRNDDHERYRKVKRGITRITVKKPPAKPKKDSKHSSDKDKKDTTPTKKDITPTKTDTKKDATPNKNDTSSPSKKVTPKKDISKSPSSTSSTTPTTSTTSTTTSASPSGDGQKKIGKRSYSDMSEEEKKEYDLCHLIHQK
jgi:hypothetical protein